MLRQDLNLRPPGYEACADGHGLVPETGPMLPAPDPERGEYRGRGGLYSPAAVGGGGAAEGAVSPVGGKDGGQRKLSAGTGENRTKGRNALKIR